jgi:hypothetical protein
MPTMPDQQSSCVKWEEEGGYSRKDVTVVSGQNLARNTVLGRITASGKVTAWTTGASDGSQNAIGILLDPVNASAGDQPGVAVVREAKFSRANLVFAGTPNDTQKNAAIAALEALGVVPRATA